MSTATSHASCRLGANILRSSKQRNDTLGDFNPPQTSEERVFQSRPGRKIWSLACHGCHDGIHQHAGFFFTGNHTATKVTNHGSVLSTFLFLDQSEKSPDSGLATDK